MPVVLIPPRAATCRKFRLRKGLRSTPCRTRTCNLRFRRPMLYPIELRAHSGNLPLGRQNGFSAPSAERLQSNSAPHEPTRRKRPVPSALILVFPAHLATPAGTKTCQGNTFGWSRAGTTRWSGRGLGRKAHAHLRQAISGRQLPASLSGRTRSKPAGISR